MLCILLAIVHCDVWLRQDSQNICDQCTLCCMSAHQHAQLELQLACPTHAFAVMMHTCLQQLVFVAETAVRPGIKVDTTKSQVPDPNSIPAKGSKALPATIWRVDRLREMTYTQFWQLIQERQIERVCCNNASVSVLPYCETACWVRCCMTTKHTWYVKETSAIAPDCGCCWDWFHCPNFALTWETLLSVLSMAKAHT